MNDLVDAVRGKYGANSYSISSRKKVYFNLE